MNANRRLVHFFDSQIAAFERLAAEVSKSPTKNRVHELRIVTRRLRAILWLLRNDPSIESHRREERALRKLGKVLGRQRELDVALRDAGVLKLDVSALKGRRAKARKAAQETFGSPATKRLGRRLKEILKQLKSDPEVLHTEKSLEKLRRRLDRWQGTEPRREDLHELRIVAKKIRYILEALGRSTEPLRELQDHLGDVHDMEVLQEFLGEKKKTERAAAAASKEARRFIAPALTFARHELQRLEA